jgi:hypothetical protein
MRIIDRADSRTSAASTSALLAFLIAATLAAPVRAAAQGAVSTQDPPSALESSSSADSARSYDEPSSVWNAHRLVRVMGDGTHVVLGDGTIWEIFLPDRPSVNTWRRGDLLVVRPSGVTQGDFDYSLIDGRTRRAVAARLVGAASRRG